MKCNYYKLQIIEWGCLQINIGFDKQYFILEIRQENFNRTKQYFCIEQKTAIDFKEFLTSYLF